MENLQELREAIDSIDGKLLALLNERAALAQQIGLIKKRSGRPVYAPERAEQLMRRLTAQSTGPLDAQAIRSIYREIMSASLALEKDTVIATEGEIAGMTHLAAIQQFGSSVRYSFHKNPSDLFNALTSGDADCGVIPFEEEGPDAAVLELLTEGKVFLCSQIVLGVRDTVIPSRYLVLGREPNVSSGDDQTALLVHLTDQPGTLAAALDPFRITGVNVLSIHSRRSRKGGLHLLLEVEGHASNLMLQKAIDVLKSSGMNPIVCGSYPRFHASSDSSNQELI